MRKIKVSKKVKVVAGYAMFVDTTTEQIIKSKYTVRDTGYPEVEIKAGLADDIKLVTILSTVPHEIRYSMDLEEFIRFAHPEYDPFASDLQAVEADAEICDDQEPAENND